LFASTGNHSSEDKEAVIILIRWVKPRTQSMEPIQMCFAELFFIYSKLLYLFELKDWFWQVAYKLL
jgi:hypothetical protein